MPGDPAEAGLAAYTAALTAAGAAAFLLELGGGYPAVVAAVALHVWLTLPALAPAGAAVRLGAVALGWAGLAAVIALTAAPGGLGGGAPGWLVRLAGSGAIPFAAAAGIAVAGRVRRPRWWRSSWRVGVNPAGLAYSEGVTMRRFSRRLGTTLMAVGLGLIVYAGAVVFWQDPVTIALHGLRAAPAPRRPERVVRGVGAARRRRPRAGRGPRAGQHPGCDAGEARPGRPASARCARWRAPMRVRPAAHEARAIGRIRAPRMGLSTVFVEGTDYWSSLSKGPGRYRRTRRSPASARRPRSQGTAPRSRPRSARSTACGPGDWIVLELPYGTLSYRVTGHKVVDNGDWSIIKNRGYDQLVLSACHPLYSADQRWVVFAKLASIQPRGAERAVAV